MFRSIGQVLGVSLSAAIVQAVISKDLRRLIKGDKAAEVGLTVLSPEEVVNTRRNRLSTSFVIPLRPSANLIPLIRKPPCKLTSTLFTSCLAPTWCCR